MPNWSATECIFYPQSIYHDPGLSERDKRVLIGLFRDPTKMPDAEEIAATLHLAVRKVKASLRHIESAGYTSDGALRQDLVEGSIQARNDALREEMAAKRAGTWRDTLHLYITE
jgi:hypothetical protein